MPALSRSGVSLPELLIALAIGGIIAAGSLRGVRGLAEVYRREALEIERARSLRVAAALLPAELRELDTVDGDLVAMGPTSLTIRAPRQLAVLCRAPRLTDPPTRATLTLRAGLRFGVRDFDPRRDSLWIFYDGNPGTRDDDGWLQASIDSLGADLCPDGRPGSSITGTLRPTARQYPGPGAVPSGAPVLGFETVTYRLYRSSGDGRWYMGLEAAGDLQPLLGPVTREGLSFAYLEASGAPTTEAGRVALIELRVRAPTAELVRTRDRRLDAPVDSLVRTVAPRNGPRF